MPQQGFPEWIFIALLGLAVVAIYGAAIVEYVRERREKTAARGIASHGR